MVKNDETLVLKCFQCKHTCNFLQFNHLVSFLFLVDGLIYEL